MLKYKTPFKTAHYKIIFHQIKCIFCRKYVFAINSKYITRALIIIFFCITSTYQMLCLYEELQMKVYILSSNIIKKFFFLNFVFLESKYL